MDLSNSIKQKVVPKARALCDLVEADAERFDTIYKAHQTQLNKSIRRRAYTEAYLLAWTMVEQNLLPSLVRQVAHQAKFKKVPKLEDRNVSSVIEHYYFLSQDLGLYESLLRANKDRKKLIHGLKTTDDIVSVNKTARLATRFLLEKVTVEILNRLASKTEIPVLSLYRKGWNDCREEVLRRFQELRS